MAYSRNYNNNNKYDGGYTNRYYKNNYNFQNKNFKNNYRVQNNKPAFNGFDASTYKKPDIELKGLTGKIYKISGNFSMAFASQIFKTMERVNKVTKSNLSDIEKFPELYDLLKDWTLELLNLNTEGVTYSMDAVLRDFNDIYVMNNLLNYIAGFMGKNASALMQEAQKGDNQ